MTWVQMLLGIAGPLIAKIFVFLAISKVTINGLDVASEYLQQLLQDTWNSLPADILGLLGVCGANTAMGMIAGAYMFRVAIWIQIKSVQFLTKRG